MIKYETLVQALESWFDVQAQEGPAERNRGIRFDIIRAYGLREAGGGSGP